jgi:glyoxylase I family protein
MTETIPFISRRAVAPKPGNGFPEVHRLHHFAYKCRNARETVAFYEGILGLPLASVVSHDYVPSTGEFQPYCHIFFEMADGSYIAFFDIFDGKLHKPDPDTPTWVNHLALQVDSHEALLIAKQKLQANGVDVLGPTIHGTFDSIYFFDPNGIRLELAWDKADTEVFVKSARTAHEKFEAVMKKYAPDQN